MINQKGITLVSLVITVIVIMILASITTVAGLDSIETSKKTTFVTQLEMVQAKVNTIYEKRKLNRLDIDYYNSLGKDIFVIDELELNNILADVSKEGFRYFSKEDLNTIDLENISQDVLINYDTRAVYSRTGIEIDGNRYYRLEDIPNYVGNKVEYNNKNNTVPTFSVDYTKQTQGWNVVIKDISYGENVNGGTISHKLNTDTNWILDGETTSFTVMSAGLYDIRLTDKAGNSTIVQKYINYDYITNGLIAYYDAENNTGNGHSNIVDIWKDLSNSGNDAILTNFSHNENSGWLEKSLQCSNSGEEVQIPVSIEGANTFSVDIVIKEAIEYNSGGNVISSNVNWKAFAFNTHGNDGSIYIGGNFIDGGEDNRFNPSEISYKTTPNKIDTLTYTYNGQTKEAIFYANGKKVAQKIFTNDTQATQYFEINASQLAYSRINIYNKVLSEDEIRQNHEIDKYRFDIK